MTEKIFFISDIEMGRGDIMDDFSDDDAIVNFIEKILSENPDTHLTLVLNGDIFDFLKMAYKGQYPRHITEEISLWKLEEVIKNHKAVFDAWKKFASVPDRKLFFVIGNHDADLAWPSLQQKIRETLKSSANVFFGFTYENRDIHAEHGHLVDPFFSFNTRKALIRFRGRKILNAPWGSQICFRYLNPLKKKFPKEDQLHPKPLVLDQNQDLKKYKKALLNKIFLKEIFWNGIVRCYNPAYRVPYLKLLGHFLHFGLDFMDDARFLPRAIKKIVKKNPEKDIIVLGHSHVLGQYTLKNKKIFVTDTWRNEFNVTRNLEKKRKSYVEICYQDDLLGSANMKLL